MAVCPVGPALTPLTRYDVACNAAKSVWDLFGLCGGTWHLVDGATVTYEDVVLLGLARMLPEADRWQLHLAYYPPEKQSNVFTDVLAPGVLES